MTVPHVTRPHCGNPSGFGPSRAFSFLCHLLISVFPSLQTTCTNVFSIYILEQLPFSPVLMPKQHLGITGWVCSVLFFSNKCITMNQLFKKSIICVSPNCTQVTPTSLQGRCIPLNNLRGDPSEIFETCRIYAAGRQRPFILLHQHRMIFLATVILMECVLLFLESR